MIHTDHHTGLKAGILAAVALAVLLAPLRPGGSALAAENGKQAPDFQLVDLAGKTQRLSDHRGNVVVLNFWATWCPECIAEIGSLNAFAEQYRKKGVVVLGVSEDASESALREFLRAHPVAFPVMIDRASVARTYVLRGLPATLIIDRQGGLAAKLMGAQEFLSPDFTGKIDGLLGK